MDTLFNLRPGKWSLIILPRSMRSNILVSIGHLAERCPILVLDGGNGFNAYTVSRAVQGREDVLRRIRISRAFSCHQMASLLEGISQVPKSVVCLDFLSTFFDESLPVRERQRLLEACLLHFTRLNKLANLIVTISPPKVILPETAAFLELLGNAAGAIWTTPAPLPAPEPLRLF
jgi:hypothetical protein